MHHTCSLGFIPKIQSRFTMAFLPDNAPKKVILSTQAHCEECRFSVMSMFRKVQGVYSVAIDADRNTITIGGSSAPKELLETLIKVSQDAEFCIKPPAHVSPSSCPVVQDRPSPLRTCSNLQGGCRTTAPPRCCACTGQGRVAPRCNSHYHGRY